MRAAQGEVREQAAARPRPGAGTVVAVLVVAVAVVWGVSTVRPPDRFLPNADGEVTMSVSMSVDETLYVGIAHGDHEVSLDEATLVVDDSSALAAVDLVACRRRDGAASLGSGSNVPLSDYCRSVEKPTEVPVGGPTDGTETYLLAVIRPMESGRIFIDGVALRHSWGPFDRTERTGPGVEVLVD